METKTLLLQIEEMESRLSQLKEQVSTIVETQKQLTPQWQFRVTDQFQEVFVVESDGTVKSCIGVTTRSSITDQAFSSLILAQKEARRRRAERIIVAAIERCNIRNNWVADFEDDSQNKNYIVYDPLDSGDEIGFVSTEETSTNTYQCMPVQFYFGCNYTEVAKEIGDYEDLKDLIKDWLQIS